MLRFEKQNGEAFNLDYMGTIFVRDSGNDLVAVCNGGEPFSYDGFQSDDIIDNTYDIGEPDKWDDWTIIIDISDSDKVILQRAIATAWNSVSLCERMVREYAR